jgi:hypothetical protein
VDGLPSVTPAPASAFWGEPRLGREHLILAIDINLLLW